MSVDGRPVMGANVDIDAKHRAFGFGGVKEVPASAASQYSMRASSDALKISEPP